MEKLWSHTSLLGTSLFDVCFPDNSSLLSFLSRLPLSSSYLLRLLCFHLLNACEYACTHPHTYVHTHYMTNADWGQLHSPVVRCSVGADLLYLYACLPGWLEHLLKPSVKRHSIHLWQRGEQCYLHQFSPRRGEFPVNGQLFFFSCCFNNCFSKWPPFRRTDETRSQAATHMLINSIKGM